MRPTQYTVTAVLFLVLCQLTVPSFGQLGFTFDIKKPKEYEERTLRSERSEEKKFNLPRRFIQNTVTHYNYFFNANNKLNEVLERAKESFRDDYSRLLPFYNYTLDMTAQDSIQLDSITYKSTTGIALHDLRNDWVDNLYLLWGAAYYLRKEFDSAYLMFQFINYAFAPKEKDGYYVTIGSGMDGNKAYSISTKEKNSLPRKVFSEPPSRNDAFIWQIRNFLAQDQFAEAASLIVTLRNDPVFPKRLEKDLEEVQAFWFYKQNMWDSAAIHLVKALDNATNKQEKARWEFLVAQLYEMTGKDKEAEKFYSKVITHTTDPIMDIYARLYSIRVHKDSSDNYIDKNVNELMKMARRDKFEEYRDIIYYMAAQMQLERNNIEGAVALLQKGAEFLSGDIAQRNKIYLQLAELAFAKRMYRQAYSFYDSVQVNDPSIKDPAAIIQRKDMLGRITSSMETIERQDSLQRVASMPEEDRKIYIDELVRRIRKEQGLKDEGTRNTAAGSPVNTFFRGGGDQKGEWIFYNSALRTKGLADFKSKWGNRSNSDNWRRSGTGQGANMNNPLNPNGQPLTPNTTTDAAVTYDNLYANLPLDSAKLKISNDSIQQAMFLLGKTYIQEVEDCSAGTETLEGLRNRFPQFEKMDEALFNLYYCYNKNGETGKAANIKKLLTEKYPSSNFTTILNTGKDPRSKAVNTDATRAYEKVYDLFVEGKFVEAVAEKKTADSLYGRNFWTPQLRYIEAVYYIRERDDSTAKNILRDIIGQYAGTPLAARSATLLDVLGRRQQIEDELRNLSVTRYQDNNNNVSNVPVTQPPVVKKDTTVSMPVQQPVNNPVVKPIKDTVATKPVQTLNSPYAFSPGEAQYVVIILNKVDWVFVNEAKNAFFRYNRETYYNKQMTLEIADIDADNHLVLISPFANSKEAVDYVDKAKPKAAGEIVPWLKAGKYSFSIISEKNLALLKENKDIEAYKRFLEQYLPGKF
jgi:tetratricopeptide (TPR) repeat protein